MPMIETSMNSSRGIICILLEPTGSKKGQFQRHGILEMDLEDYNIVSREEVRNQEWLEFEEDVGEGQYVISII